MEPNEVAMPSLRISKQNDEGTHFVTLTVIEWINVFTKLEYFEVLIESLKYCQAHKGLVIYGYVLMTNHIHAILEVPSGGLIRVIADFKRFTTREIMKLIKKDNRRYIQRLIKNSYSKKKGYQNQIWWRENHPKLVESDWFFQQKLNYIHENPVVAGYVDYEDDWRYSSARNYYNEDHSVIEVVTI